MSLGCELPLGRDVMHFHPYSMDHNYLDEAFNRKMAGQEGIGTKPLLAQNLEGVRITRRGSTQRLACAKGL